MSEKPKSDTVTIIENKIVKLTENKIVKKKLFNNLVKIKNYGA